MGQKRRSRHQLNRRVRHIGEPSSHRGRNHGVQIRGLAARPPLISDMELSRALSQGLAALSCFTAMQPRLALHEIAERLRMSVPTAQMYVSTLLRLGYLEQGADHRLCLGRASVDVGNAFLDGLPVRQHALPLLRRLRDITGHTASLAILDGADMVYASRISGHAQGQFDADLQLRAGARLALHHTAAGRVLLAHLPLSVMHAVIADLELQTDNDISQADARCELVTHLEQIRADGIATVEHTQCGASRTIAAPIIDGSDRALAAIELTVSSGDYHEDLLLAQLAPILRETCAMASTHALSAGV